jgi:heavy metal sensor kinase
MRIGARLTLAGTLVTLAVCTVVCVALYVGLRISLHREIDVFLEGEAQEFAAMLHEDASTSLEHVQNEIRHELGSRLRADLTFRLLDSNGAVIVSSDPRDDLPNPWDSASLQKGRHRARWYETIGGAGGVRICSEWTDFAGEKHVAQATYALDSVAASLAKFRRIGFAALALAAGLSLVGGRLMARKSLLPIQSMTDRAQSIGATNLGERLTRSGNSDELDRLAGVLNDMLTRLERQFRQVQQFTADAAHELRTPLAALRGSVEIALSRGAGAEELRSVLVDSIEEFDRLSRLTDDLLLLARADSGRKFLNREPVAFHVAVQDMVDLFAPLAQDRRVNLTCNTLAPVQLNADGGRLRQVLSNLLDNAIKYTPAGGSIAVDLVQTDGVAELRVNDTGIGIPEADLPKIFDRFYRVDAARTRSTGGVGLGLAICRTIVEAHGGRIDLQSIEGKGCSAIVRLPAAMAD